MNSHELSEARNVGRAASARYAIMVLLVDDQAMIGEAVRRALLGEPDIDFHYCADPAEAVAVAKEIKPTVILQDLVMPGVDGLDAGSRSTAPTRPPATFRSSCSRRKEEPTVKSDAFAAGANDYLVKLPDQIELIARIRYHSKAYLNQLQRDEAYRALRESQQQLLETNLELQRLTNVDGLTGLSNRRYFDEYIGAEWKRGAARPDAALGADDRCRRLQALQRHLRPPRRRRGAEDASRDAIKKQLAGGRPISRRASAARSSS